jgi:predicted transcriptional regulator of viral defense system
MDRKHKLFEIADRQQGYFTAQQAQECSFSRPNFHLKLKSGEWTKEMRGIYRLAHYPASERPELVLWILWSCDKKGTPQGIWSHETALDIRELSDIMPAKMHMTVPTQFKRRIDIPKQLHLHFADIPEAEIETCQGYRITTPLRTLVDVDKEGGVSSEHIAQAIREALQRGMISHQDLLQTPQLLRYNMEKKEKRKPTYQHILVAEERVQNETQIAFAKWFVKFEEIINLFFEMLYFKKYCTAEISSAEYSFFWYAKDIYTEIPCSLRSCSLLLETGYYTDALGSCRTLLEALVKLKYFFDRKNSISPYFKTEKDENGKKIRIINLFEKVAPKAYEKNYGFLCRFVHKGIFTGLPSLAARLNSRVKGGSGQEAFLPLPTFSRPLAEIVIKHLLALVSGYLNAAPFFLSYELAQSDSLFLARYENLKRWVTHAIQTNKADFPSSREWSELMEEIAQEPQSIHANDNHPQSRSALDLG